VINITSKRQQQAWQFEQVTAAGCSTALIDAGVDDLSDDSGNMVMILVGI